MESKGKMDQDLRKTTIAEIKAAAKDMGMDLLTEWNPDEKERLLSNLDEMPDDMIIRAHQWLLPHHWTGHN